MSIPQHSAYKLWRSCSSADSIEAAAFLPLKKRCELVHDGIRQGRPVAFVEQAMTCTVNGNQPGWSGYQPNRRLQLIDAAERVLGSAEEQRRRMQLGKVAGA